MHIRITNLTGRLVVISLNSGRSLILSPAETSAEIPATETRGNRMVEKMNEERVITVQGRAQTEKPKTAARTKKPVRHVKRKR